MTQYVLKNKLYICGSISDVLEQLRKLSCKFRTLKEFLDFNGIPDTDG